MTQDQEKESTDANSDVWSRDAPQYLSLDSWTDVGERTVLTAIADEVRGRPILDVGVGTGRSAWLLHLLTDDYLGIDYESRMITLARQQHPQLRLRCMDARDLHELADDTFAMVFFSHAGLDSLDHEGRAQALREFARVTAPGGLVVYSTLNRDGEFFHQGPGPVLLADRSPATSLARFAARATLHPRRHVAAFRNVREHRSVFVDASDWAVDTMPTHDWRLVVHYVTVRHAVAEAASAGLTVTQLVSREGATLSPEENATSTAWFHVVARAPGTG